MKFVLLLIILNLYLIKCFEEILIETSIKEEEENGTELLDLREKIPSLSKLNSSEGYKIKFVRECLNFYLDETNLFKILSLKIDREEICRYEMSCLINCDLLIENEEIKLIKLKISIEDINDHKPKFVKKNYKYEINELNLNVIELEEAEDEDLNKENTYLINSTTEDFPFEINFNKEKHFLELILIKTKLINKMKYEFELIVIDENNSADNCFIEINIIKNDLNSPPEFELNLYKFILYNLNSTFIGKVNLKSQQSNIFYHFISSYSNNLFEINSKTGEIYLKSNENFNSFDQFYELFIEATNFNSISSLTTVHIYFNLTSSSFNDHFIQILIPKLFQKNQNQNQIFIKENSSIPLTILQLFTSSAHLTMNSSINNRNYFHLKQFDQQSFELILFKSFDFEIYQNIYLDFQIYNFTKKSIQIFIENINDCQPTFNQTNFNFQIKENNQIPFLINTFQAFDQDFLNNLTYHIQTKDEETFSINSTTGELWSLKSFDREIKSNYSLLICVFDQIYETCSTVFIEILDENDNICYFNSSIINLTINENLPSNTYLIQSQGFDLDSEENSKLHYNFSSLTSYLNINSTTGIIKTTINSFDYELFQKYSIEINACDNINSFPSFCCSLKLNINLIDLNDNLPYLIYPSSMNDLFIINYTNKIMPQLKAFDNDIELKNRFIYYSIIGGSLNSSLSIDYYSGQLFLLSTSSILPLYGTLIISISSQTIIQLTILIYDNQTNLSTFLKSIQQQQQSSYSFLLFILLGIIILIFIIFFIIFYFFKRKSEDDRLMNTPSTTTLSTRSISTSNQKKIYDTYYSFGDSVSPDIIHL